MVPFNFHSRLLLTKYLTGNSNAQRRSDSTWGHVQAPIQSATAPSLFFFPSKCVHDAAAPSGCRVDAWMWITEQRGQCCHKQLGHWSISSVLPNRSQAMLASGKARACLPQFFPCVYQVRLSNDCHCYLVLIHWQKVFFFLFCLPERTKGSLYCPSHSFISCNHFFCTLEQVSDQRTFQRTCHNVSELSRNEDGPFFTFCF